MRREVIVGTFLVIAIVMCGCASTVRAPYSSEEILKVDPEKLETAFADSGFNNIIVNEIDTKNEDKAGTLYSVTINGKSNFTTDNSFANNAEVIITVYALETFEPTIEIEDEGSDGFPQFVISTNLPNKTKLTLTVINDTYTEQQELTVKSGTATSEIFYGYNGSALVGDYTINVVVTLDDQKGEIIDMAGEDGGELVGDLVAVNPETGDKYIYYETSYHSEHKPYTADAESLKELAIDLFGFEYEELSVSYDDFDEAYVVSYRPNIVYSESVFVYENVNRYIEYCKVAYQIEGLERVRFDVLLLGQDQYGKDYEIVGLSEIMLKSEFEKFNWDNLEYLNIYDAFADGCYYFGIAPEIAGKVDTSTIFYAANVRNGKIM